MSCLNNPDLIGFQLHELNFLSVPVPHLLLSKPLFTLCLYIEVLGNVSVDLARLRVSPVIAIQCSSLIILLDVIPEPQC